MRKLLTVSHLSQRYGPITAVDNVGLALQPGQRLGLLGPQNAGKTTALQVIQGLLRPSKGKVSILGYSPAQLPDAAHTLGCVFPGVGLPRKHTVKSYLINHQRTTGLSRDEMAAAVERFALDPLLQRRIGSLTAGERVRVALATATAGSPRLLLVDEPCTGLTEEEAGLLKQTLRQYVDAGGALLISGHSLPEIEDVVDDILVIRRRCLFYGSLDELRQYGDTLNDAYLRLLQPYQDDRHIRPRTTPQTNYRLNYHSHTAWGSAA
ncbi:ABC transporter ATP-binding protein [Actinomyces sp. MRS3W]|uniref:ABC transporter ATP-binding protein n=1 Tax=Actinomyces sp. MRS3W TaxID=2800796 RepID=UPI0028FD17E3|nr:ABC transporter ATP-binding protein [Actinomyces sp. MRS3W]MDU0348404.1 ABC transporter ATP-binding protein [Actinomyces sp. MRS3W]